MLVLKGGLLQVNVGNQAPVADAGPSQTIILPANSVTLNGKATDDGLPGGALAVLWSKVSGPGTVTFTNPNEALTTTSFSVAGTYVLRLNATDSHLTSSSDVTITVASVSVPTLLSINPNSGAPGQSNIPVTVTGQNTHFTNASTIDLGPGI